MVVAALFNGEKCFPLKTPRRWQLVAEYVKKSVLCDNDKECEDPVMIVGYSKSSVEFDYSPEHCKELFHVI